MRLSHMPLAPTIDIQAQFDAWFACVSVLPVERMQVAESVSMESLIRLGDNYDFDDDLTGSFEYRLIKSRARGVNVELTNAAAAFLILLCRSVTDAVVYASYLRGWLNFNPAQGNRVTLTMLRDDIFPRGFLTRGSTAQAWQLQKLNGAALLDLVVGRCS